MEELISVKDDTELFESIEHGQERRRQYGVPEPSQTSLGDRATLKAEWHKLRRQRTGHGFYHVVIEPTDGHYRAYPLAAPGMVVEGETPRVVRKKVAETLRVYLIEVLAQGESSAAEGKLVETVEVSLT